ncbi:hypothetical protein EWI07_06635 [Sporolactobacillus sp. THM7-4]|nr:hypothetical protein EWI07_06635 [Sporolactobacillus sp. THM7-4]
MLNNLRAFIRGNRQDRDEGYIISSSKWVTGLMVVGIFLYNLTGGWGTVVALSLAVALLIGRYLLVRQATGDFRDMHHAKKCYGQTKNKDYLRFIKARGEQMLNDNKVLTQSAKAEIQSLIGFADKYI